LLRAALEPIGLRSHAGVLPPGHPSDERPGRDADRQDDQPPPETGHADDRPAALQAPK
jgi:hypothetical protein